MAVVPNPGDTLRGRTSYTIEEVLNKGDASIACRARDGDGTTVFLKFYKTPSKFKPWFESYLHYEIELNRRLETDSQLRQKSVFATDIFIGKLDRPGQGIVGAETQIQVFPFISGQITLEELMKSGFDGKPLDWQKRLLVATVTLAAMRDLHKARIVHSDLKPKNFQVAKEKTLQGALERPLIVDMDFSVLVDRKAPWHDDPNQGYVGSPGYFSPEHVSGTTPIPASDVFTMAEILCELLCGKHPFESVFGEKEEYKNRIFSGRTDFGTAPFPFLDGKTIPDLERELRRALSPDPGNRPTMEELHKAVAKVLNVDRPSVGGASRPFARSRRPMGFSTTKPIVQPDRPKPILTPAAPPSQMRLSLSGAAGSVQFGVRTKISRATIKRVCGSDEALFASSSTHFILDTDGKGWFAEPGDAVRTTLLNGRPLKERTLVSDGDELAIEGSSGGSKTRAPMKVSLSNP